MESVETTGQGIGVIARTSRASTTVTTQQMPDNAAPPAPTSQTRDDLVAAALGDLDPSIADLFRKGRSLCSWPDSPALAYLLAHCGRELSNVVIRQLETTARQRTTPAQILEQLSEAISVALDLPLSAEVITAAATAVQNAFDVREREEVLPLRVASALSLPRTDPVVGRWTTIHNAFQGSAHARVPSPPVGPLRVYFDELSSLLYARTGPIFDTRTDVDGLAELAHPTEDDVALMRSRTVRPHQRRRFFMRVESAEWLEPLRIAGFFSHPPDRLVHEDGSWQLVAWPEGEYLLRMASHRPAAVAEILRSIPANSENPFVWAVIADALVALPEEYVAPLARLLKSAPSIVFQVMIGHKALEVAVSLATRRRDEAFVVMHSVLRMRSAIVPSQAPAENSADYVARLRVLGTRVFSSDSWVLETLDVHDLPLLLTTAVAALEQLDGDKALRLLAGRLVECIRAVRSVRFELYERVVTREALTVHKASDEADAVDEESLTVSRWLDPFSQPPTSYESDSQWCEDVRDGTIRGNVREGFAHALYAMGIRLSDDASALESVLAVMDTYNAIGIFPRIQMALLAEGRELSPSLVARANAFARNETALWPGSRGREIASLLRAHFEELDSDVQETLATRLKDGPPTEWVTDHLLFFGIEDSPDERSDIIQDWQRSRLRWFHDRIPAILRPLAEKLAVAAEVPAERQQSLDETGSWSSGVMTRGAYSAADFDRLSGLDAQALIQYLASWHVSDTEGEENGREGETLRAALMALGTQDPDRLPEWVAALDTTSVDLAFLDSIALGIRAALAQGTPVDGHSVIRLATVLLNRASSPPPGVTLEPQRHTMTKACELIQELVERSPLTPLLISEAWALADRILDSPVVWTEEGSLEPLENFDSLRQRCWSSLTGRAMEMLLVLAWKDFETRRFDSQWVWPPLVNSPIEERLAHHLDRAITDTSTNARLAQASLGQKLGQLFWMAPVWVERHLATLFDGGDTSLLAHPAFGMYVTNHRPRVPLFNKLRTWYAAVASATALPGTARDEDRRGRVRDSILNHVVAALLDQIALPADSDHLVENAFASATAEQRSRCYWGIYRSWSDASAESVVDRVPGLVRLWSWRLDILDATPSGPEKDEELQGMDMLVATPHLSIDDALRLTERTVAMTDRRARQFTSAWSRIAEMTAHDPARGMQVVDRIVRSILQGEYPYLPFDEVAPALRYAIEAGGDTRAQARRLIDALGLRGLEDFAELWREL
ncbi:MAG: hypothetical protein JWM95_5243 [Gemmatimonadetes bacterium]|nr:hypothetical protein [Gemmatimonadota bacterium]